MSRFLTYQTLSKVRMRPYSTRPWRGPIYYSPTILPITLAALLTAITVQPAGDHLPAHQKQDFCASDSGEMYSHTMITIMNCSEENEYCSTHCGFLDLGARCCANLKYFSGKRNEVGNVRSHLFKDVSFAKQETSLLSNADVVALIVRTTFILLEFGSRPLKNAKKILSCGLICIWLYRYRFGMTDQFANLSRLQPSFNIFAENASFVIFFLVVRLSLKMADLLKIFKRQKGLRIVKLVKLAKLVKIGKWFLLGNISWKLAIKIFRMLKLLKLLKISRKCKRILPKRHFKAFKLFKAFKIIKVLNLAAVVFMLEDAISPAAACSVCTR